MSLFELIVILLVGLLMIKPEDLPKLIKKFKEIQSFITNTKKEIISHIDPLTELDDSKKNQSFKNLDYEMEQMNFYLEKIANLDSEYEGDYSLSSAKEHYRKLINEKMKKEMEDRES
jgi:Sec-independent protein translocase protein TatA